MKTVFCVLFLYIITGLNTSVSSQNIENGIYISYKGGIIPKYAILKVNDDSIKMEIFTRWQGAWLPAIGSWDATYSPQILKHTAENLIENENIRIVRKRNDKILGIVKNTYAGRIRFKLEQVEILPKKYQIVRQRSLEFTKRNTSK